MPTPALPNEGHGWGYRIVHYKEGGYGLHEVYYNESGEPWSMTESPVRFASHEHEGPDGVCGSLQMALDDARSCPVIEEPTEWASEPIKSGHKLTVRHMVELMDELESTGGNDGHGTDAGGTAEAGGSRGRD